MSDWVPVLSGVPQGTVLGPMLFLAFINDLPKSVTSSVRLFADDCVLYRSVANDNDCDKLQEDLLKLEEWEDTWCMNFNPSKCSTISITRKKNKVIHQYSLHEQILQQVSSATYLGIELSADLSWTNHINKTTKKANKQLAFVKRNLPINNIKVKESAYKGLVRPILEYSSTVWDPYQKKYIDQLEMVQRRAARYTLGRFNNRSSVSDMLQQLQWDSLEVRRQRARLIMFYKVLMCIVAIPLPSIVVQKPRPRPGYPHQFMAPYCRTEAYKK